MITYKTTKSKKGFKNFLATMREYELYTKKSVFSGFYQIAHMSRYFDKIISMVICETSYDVIGVAIRFDGNNPPWGCAITCYVKPEHRHQGIGSELVKKIATKKVIDSGAHQFPVGFPSYGRKITT